MKNRKYIFAAATAMMLSLTGCTDWLEQKPISNVTTGSYFTKAADFESAANRLYDQLYGFATTFSSNEMLGFNFDIGTDLNIAQNEELSGTAGVGTSDVYYTKPYQCLRHVNNLLQLGRYGLLFPCLVALLPAQTLRRSRTDDFSSRHEIRHRMGTAQVTL